MYELINLDVIGHEYKLNCTECGYDQCEGYSVDGEMRSGITVPEASIACLRSRKLLPARVKCELQYIGDNRIQVVRTRDQYPLFDLVEVDDE